MVKVKIDGVPIHLCTGLINEKSERARVNPNGKVIFMTLNAGQWEIMMTRDPNVELFEVVNEIQFVIIEPFEEIMRHLQQEKTAADRSA